MSERHIRTRKLVRLRELREQQAATALQSSVREVIAATEREQHADAALCAWAKWKQPLGEGALSLARYALANDAEQIAFATLEQASDARERATEDCDESRQAYRRAMQNREVVEYRHAAQTSAAALQEEHKESDATGELWMLRRFVCE